MCVKAGAPSMRRQCELLGVARSSLSYQPEGQGDEDLELMRIIDELHLKYPFYGSRRVSAALRAMGRVINRKHVQRLMQQMGLEGLGPKPKTSPPSKENPAFPYLLRNMRIERVNHVWAADITYIPMARGFAYLVAIIDWASRRVLAWRLSNTMDTAFCIDALQDAFLRFEPPEIFNTDQGAQFNSTVFTNALLERGVKVSMDGKGRWVDNVFIERLWRSLKYEEVYLHAYENLDDARRGIDAYINFYNRERPHQSLGYQTPASFYELMAKKAA